MPDMMPLVEVMVTTEGLLLVQLPPVEPVVSTAELLTHNPETPLITGVDITVMVLVVWQVPNV
jgi:hypothetical protein